MDVEPGTSKEQSKNGPNAGYTRKFKRNQKGSERHKPYFGSQKEGQGFADLRKKKAAREYLKYLQKEQQKDGVSKSKKESSGHAPPLKLFEILGKQTNKAPKGSAFSHAQKIGEEKRKKKEEEREEFLKEKEAKDAAIKVYKAKKKERFLKLCKKTRKGQPVMKNQMEVLLEKIMKHKGMDKESDDSKG